MELQYSDMAFVVRRLPTDIRSLLKDYEGRLFVAGGFIRAVVAGETPNDIDIFGTSKDVLAEAAAVLVSRRGENTRQHKTKNAITIISSGRMTVQFITRWVFAEPSDCAASFDFTVCQSVIWRDNATYRSICSGQFYVDLAARRLVYTSPKRDEEAGGSLMRVLKYGRRGYSIQAASLGAVIARLTRAVDFNRIDNEERLAQVLSGLIREVDPNIIVDGLDVSDDHETPIEGISQ